MIRPLSAILAAVALLGATPTFAPGASLGIVLMHGKWGKTSNVEQLKRAFERQGDPVETPEMPWSGRRLYDAPYAEALR
jgi:esterase/lipase